MKIKDKDDRESNRDYALRVIRENIINLQLKPGSMISEQDLADELSISRTPVHEALQEISKTKIIEVFPQKGSHVSLIDMKLVNEARFVRSTLEAAIIELAVEAATQEDIEELEENINLQEFYQSKEATDKLMELDNIFHEMMYKIADKTQTYYMVKTMNIHYDRFRELRYQTSDASPIVIEHRQILEAFQNKDKDKAREILIHHLNRTNTDYKEIIKKYENFFKKD